MAQSTQTAGVALSGHESSSLAFDLVLQPSSICEKLLDTFNSNKNSSKSRIKEIPQPMLGVLTEFLQQLQIESKVDSNGAKKDQRRKAQVQLMVCISMSIINSRTLFLLVRNHSTYHTYLSSFRFYKLVLL